MLKKNIRCGLELVSCGGVILYRIVWLGLGLGLGLGFGLGLG